MISLKDRAKVLRRNSTMAEKKLWSLLRKMQQCGYKFRRQAPLGDFVVDFICYEAKLIIELDGRDHIDKKRLDLYRTKHLESMGFTIMRFWNYEVFTQTKTIIDKIKSKLQG
jgi:very-short-patch-repair endonuclease